MTLNRNSRWRARLSFSSYAVLLTVVTAACDRPVIEGAVQNVRGDVLPGVIVQVDGTHHEDLTDAHGQYRVGFRPGEVLLRFHKTGYTPGELELRVAESRLVEATPVKLWRLPPTPGVHVFADGQYNALTRDTPERFFLADGEMAYAIKRPPELSFEDSAPLIICYRTPRFDARLTRLREDEAKLGPGETSTFKVWRPAGSVAVDLVPIDEVENLLLELRHNEPLEPGIYSVHWGALEGHSTLESRIYSFQIFGAEPTGALEEIEPSDEETSAGTPNDSQ